MNSSITNMTIKDIEKKVRRLYNISWVVGTLAVIFGCTGAWGLTTVKSIQHQMSELNDSVRSLESRFGNIDHTFAMALSSNETKFSQYAERKKDSFISSIENTMSNKIKNINERIDKITIGVSPIKAYGGKTCGQPNFPSDSLMFMVGTRYICPNGSTVTYYENYYRKPVLTIPK